LVYKDEAYKSQPTKHETKEINLVITSHCMARLKERISFLREEVDSSIVSMLNKQLSDGVIYKDGKRNALMLGFEHSNFKFIITEGQNGMHYAVTFEHSLRYPKKGKEAKVLYVHWKEVYSPNTLIRNGTENK
jgi:hypothetical protein